MTPVQILDDRGEPTKGKVRVNWNVVFPYVLSVALAIGPVYHRFASVEAAGEAQKAATDKLEARINVLNDSLQQLDRRVAQLTTTIEMLMDPPGPVRPVPRRRPHRTMD
jgi:hypothetical protein